MFLNYYYYFRLEHNVVSNNNDREACQYDCRMDRIFWIIKGIWRVLSPMLMTVYSLACLFYVSHSDTVYWQ
jgi:hypothetical protein